MKSIKSWSTHEASELYHVAKWGNGYFAVNEAGHVEVRPRKRPGEAIDLKELVDQIRRRGIELPLLLRFTDILRHRVLEMNEAFRAAIDEYEYEGRYVGVYPIKTNQQKHVVEEFLDAGKPLSFGLECGSKPELLAVLALTHLSDSIIVCNGFKDDDYIGMVVFAQKMGKTVIPVIEKFSELGLILEHGRRLGVRPQFGIRVKLASKGSGRWKMSAGSRSKFGLTITELLDCVRVLRENDMQSGFRLVHFHLGSQITNIHAIKNAITEVARIYAELRSEHPSLEYLDVGGGLGVDYDGSQTNFESSINYTLEEYARDVIFRVRSVCDEAEVPHPTIITESGRATVAYHSVLVVNVLGVASGIHDASRPEPESPPSDEAEEPQGLTDLREIAREISEKNVLESYHDAVQTYEELLHSFKLGFLSLEQRSQAERLYHRVAQRILKIVKKLEYVPEELEGIEDQLADTYFCNFSIFQSLPDSWAIQQLFPILPIHRLGERPRRRGVLADITCDSDGRIDRFIDLRDVNRTLPLHDFDGGDYYLAVFLVGAYQEILGDLHNLFGDTNSVHISLDENGDPSVDTVVTGDTVQEVLAYVQYSPTELLAQVRKDIEAALRGGRITLEEAARFSRSYETGLRSYTYLRRREDLLADRSATTEGLGTSAAPADPVSVAPEAGRD